MVASNPHRIAVDRALRANEQLGEVFAHVGSTEHPNGVVLIAYRNALRLMRNSQGDTQVIHEALIGLNSQIENHAREVLRAGAQIGIDSARDQLGAYGEPIPNHQVDDHKIEEILAIILALLLVQANSALGLLALGADLALIFGDENHQGIIRPWNIIQALVFWIVSLWSYQFMKMANESAEESGNDVAKQAVATIDDRTTNCCLRVHAQVQPLDKPFLLTGTPRYADEMQDSPFHGHCRTTIAIYFKQFERGLTALMIKQADAQVAANKSAKAAKST